MRIFALIDDIFKPCVISQEPVEASPVEADTYEEEQPLPGKTFETFTRKSTHTKIFHDQAWNIQVLKLRQNKSS